MLTGKLVRWNDEKGYGFIHSESEKQDIFIHISALSDISRRPTVGDIIFFDMETDANNKYKATKAKIEGVPRLGLSLEPRSSDQFDEKPRQKTTTQPVANISKLPNKRTSHCERKKTSFSRKLAPLSIIIVIALVLYNTTVNNNASFHAVDATESQIPTQALPQFQCQGKTHCSQMTSCEEATFYIKHCPGTEMDGDRDGIPCESQWCN